jgi:hypothetical protein
VGLGVAVGGGSGRGRGVKVGLRPGAKAYPDARHNTWNKHETSPDADASNRLCIDSIYTVSLQDPLGQDTAGHSLLYVIRHMLSTQ